MWKTQRQGIQLSKKLGTCNGNGYLRITVDGVSRYAHRLAWLYEHGTEPKHQIDHINGDPSDNRIANLREATPAENSQNKKGPMKNNKSGIRGVSYSKAAKKWQAFIALDGETKYLGLYQTPELAGSAYEAARKSLHTFLAN